MLSYWRHPEVLYEALADIPVLGGWISSVFSNRATNASAESLNAKIKLFRAQLHGIADIPFFLYRVCTIFG
ncbi:MAG: hypothetical protein MR819_04820 [Prevotella sp.]|nr:hypothetical protein [Prevotella sp.]